MTTRSDTLEEIRMLSGIETHKEKVLRIILAGQPELKETLDSPTLKQLVQRIRLRFHLGPLDKPELHEYIAHRLQVAGRDEDDLFEEGCYDVIHRYAGGVPRLINTLCDTALLCAFADEKDVVEESDIRTAIKELGWQEHESNTGVFGAVRNIAISHTAESHRCYFHVSASRANRVWFQTIQEAQGRAARHAQYVSY